MIRRKTRWVTTLFTALMCAALSPVALAVNVGVYGLDVGAAVSTLNNNGYTASEVTLANIEGGLPAYDILFVQHPYDATGWSAPACTGLQTFLNNGKGVVLEWDASLLVFTSLGPNIYVHSTPQCALFPGVADQGNQVGTNTPIQVVNASSPLVAGLANPFAMGGASEYFYQITGFDPAIWSVPATYRGWNVVDNAALMASRYNNKGCVALGVMDFGDNGYTDATSKTLLLNLIGAAAPQGNCTAPVFRPIPALSSAALLALMMMLAGAGLLHYRAARRKA